jgi:anti-repressor protein
MTAREDETPEETMARALNIAAATMERQKLRIAQLETTAATQQAALEEARPKTLFADAVADSSSTCLIGELAKLLRQNGVEMGQNRLFAWLRSHGYLMKNNMPTQRAAEMKLFRVVERSVVQPDGYVRVTYTTKVTGKGQLYFLNHFLATPAA